MTRNTCGARAWASFAVLLAFATAFGTVVRAQNSDPPTPAGQQPAVQEQQKPQQPKISKKEEERRQKDLTKELNKPFQKWLDQDVAYIITDEERQAFSRLQNAEEREQFIEQFWARRNPNPESPDNEFKDEYYRRIAYANDHFASGIPGWRTDRGRIYIMYGPPDDRESHAGGGSYQRTPEEGGGSTSTYPFEIWRYHYIQGVGQDVEIEFVDKTMSGEYSMALDPSEKDALLHVPKVGLTFLEQEGLASKADRFGNFDGTQMGRGIGQQEKNGEFQRLERYAHLNGPPAVKYRDLQTVVDSRVSYNLLPFQVRTDYVRITSETVLAAITLQVKIKDMSFVGKDGVSKGTVNVLGQISNLTGRVVQRFEDVLQVQVPTDQIPKYLNQSRVYWQAIPLPPGLYRLTIVLKDTNSGNLGSENTGLRIPRFDEETLSASSLILADNIERLPTQQIGRGQFVIGDTKIRPTVNGQFTRDQNLGIYLQVYNLTTDQKTHKPAATIEYSLLKDDAPVAHWTETAAQVHASGEQLTLEKTLTLKQLKPGAYKLQVKVTDEIARQTIAPVATFTVQ